MQLQLDASLLYLAKQSIQLNQLIAMSNGILKEQGQEWPLRGLVQPLQIRKPRLPKRCIHHILMIIILDY